LARRLDDEVVGAVHVVGVLAGDPDLRAVAGDVDHVLGRQVLAGQRDRLVRLRGVDRGEPLLLLRAGNGWKAEQEAGNQ
jgi:hypothetical protein